MNLLKSLFISIYPLLCLVGLAISVDQYIHNYLYAAVGLFLISFPMLFFLGKLFLTDVARTEANLSFYSIPVVLGSLILSYAFVSGAAETMGALGFVLAVGWVLYLRWYSIFCDRDNLQLSKGQALPDFQLETEDGQAITSKSFIGKKSIILFYRGNWCPLCVTQVKELAQDYKLLESMGIQTILVSPQPHSHTKKLAEKFQVGFKFLVDKNNAAARQLNIISENGLPMGFQLLGYASDTVLPTIILTDEGGKIIHSDLTSNYRVRPEPRDLLKHIS